MVRRISSMNCHNILEYIVASSLCSAAAASSLCVTALEQHKGQSTDQRSVRGILTKESHQSCTSRSDRKCSHLCTVR